MLSNYKNISEKTGDLHWRICGYWRPHLEKNSFIFLQFSENKWPNNGVFPKWSRTHIEFSDFRESDKTMKHKLSSIKRFCVSHASYCTLQVRALLLKNSNRLASPTLGLKILDPPLIWQNIEHLLQFVIYWNVWPTDSSIHPTTYPLTHPIAGDWSP